MTVKFEKEGIFNYKWSGEKRKYIRKRIKKLNILTHLRDACEIAEGVTLLDIFRAVEKYKLLKFFIAQYSWCKSIDEFHSQAEEPPYTTSDHFSSLHLTALEIYWACDYSDIDEDATWLGCDSALDAVGPVTESHVKDFGYKSEEIGTETKWGISFTSMQELADLPVRLNEKVAFYSKKDRLARGTEVTPILQSKRTFSLQDVLDAIYWEISFYGSPAKKNEFRDEIRDRLDEFNEYKNGLIPEDEEKKDIDKKD